MNVLVNQLHFISTWWTGQQIGFHGLTGQPTGCHEPAPQCLHGRVLEVIQPLISNSNKVS